VIIQINHEQSEINVIVTLSYSGNEISIHSYSLSVTTVLPSEYNVAMLKKKRGLPKYLRSDISKISERNTRIQMLT